MITIYGCWDGVYNDQVIIFRWHIIWEVKEEVVINYDNKETLHYRVERSR